jgi:uncharacterized protein (DUF1778 family)
MSSPLSDSLDIARLATAPYLRYETINVRARKTSERQRLEIAIRHDVASRLERAAARRDLTVRQYVLHAIKDRLRADLADESTAVMTPQPDPVLAQLWNNRRDAAYDRL